MTSQPVISKTLTDTAVAILTARIPVCNVYEVHSRIESHGFHLTLLVVMKEKTHLLPVDLACEIAQKTPGLTVSLLCHKLKQLHPAEPDRQRFFARVLQRTALFRGLPDDPYASRPAADCDGHAPTLFAFDRLALAESLMQSARRRTVAYNIIGLAEMQQVVTLSALAVLRVGAGYVPNHHGVDLLLHLCEYLLPCREVVFGLPGETGRKVMKLLAIGPQTLYHAKHLEVPEADYADALRRTFDFNTRAVNTVSKLLVQKNVQLQFPDYEKHPFT